MQREAVTSKDYRKIFKMVITVRALSLTICTILLETGRPSILDDRTKRRLARMALRGDVETATELAQTAAAHDIVHAHKIKRLDFAMAHLDWTVEQ
ncbi:hypothetical protein EON65_23530 [archaeon]|nr:MAG: hypothetical protein EON65_23530 [archaeon]